MSYKITIERSEDIIELESPGYSVIKELHVNSTSEYMCMSITDRTEYKRNEDDTYTRKIYGYPPKRDVHTCKETKIYEQVVEHLNVSAVIAKINEQAGDKVPVFIGKT